MHFFRRIYIFLLTIVVFNCLYSPQPILPILSEVFSVGMQTVSLIVIFTMLFPGTAPVYGIIIEKFSPRIVLLISVLFLALGQFLFAAGENIYMLIAVRAFQGLTFPAVFTALVTYISQTSQSARTDRNIHLYIICTVIGGFSGRFFSGVFTTYFNWQFYFILSGVLLLVFFPGIFLLQKNTVVQRAHFKIKDIVPVFKDPLNIRLFLIIFLGFFAFSAIMNYIPFRIRELYPQSTASMIGQIYFGYLGGLLSVVFLGRLQKWIHSENTQIIIFILAGIPAIISMIIPNYAVLLAGILCLTSFFLLIHSCISGYINRISLKKKAAVNSLYVGFYYISGSLGSYFPGFIYKSAGWNLFIIFLAGIIILQLLLCLNARRYFV